MASSSHNNRALWIVLLYLVIGIAWIFTSDHVLEIISYNIPIDLTTYQTYKGIAFVLITAVLFYYLIKHAMAGQGRALEQAEISEKRYRDLAVLSPVGIYHADTKGRITYVNPRLVEMCGLSEEDCLGEGWIESVHPEDREGIYQAWQDLINKGLVYSAIFRFYRPDGTTVWVMEDGHPLYDEQGKLTGYLGTLVDITARKREEDTRRETEERLQLAVESGNVGLFDWNLVTDEVYYSPTWKKQIGYEDHEIGNDFTEWEKRVHPDDVERVKQSYRDYINGLKEEHIIEYRFRHKDGSWRWILGQATREDDEDGNPVRMLGSHVDITNLKQTEEALRESENRLSYLLSANPTVLYAFEVRDGEFQATWVSSNVERILGYTPEEMLEAYWWQSNLHTDDRARSEEIANQGLVKDKIVDEYRFRHKDGHYIWLRDEMRVIRTETTGVIEIIGSWIDVTEVRQEEERMRLYAAAFESTRDGVVVTDLDGNILTVNQAFKDITGYTEPELEGRTTRILNSGHQDEEFYRNMWEEMEKTGYWQGEIWNRRKNGEIYPEWLSISRVYDNNGKPTHYVGVFSDISQIKKSEEELEKLAHFDPLTGLPNRLLLDLRLSHAIEQTKRRGGHVGILFMDLDNFKKINDGLGHAVGDELLVATAKRLQERVRSEDTLGRFGGDEFLLVLENIKHPEEAGMVARDLLASLRRPFRLSSGNELFVEGSIGISIYPDDGLTPDDLLRDADTAMYQSKESGRNRFCFFTSKMSDSVFRELEIETALRRDMEGDKLVLYYQPKVDIQSGSMTGVEALIRWQQDDGTFISPAEFIPVAERTGLIHPVGRWSLNAACRQIREWCEKDIEPAMVAVNVSAYQFLSGDLVEIVEQTLADTSIEPFRLEIEITESTLMERPEDMVKVINRLSDMGIRITLDDFGSGYSSLGYLSRFHINVMKIDGSFTEGIETDNNSRMIVSSIIDLAHGMGMRCVAEKVQSRGQVDYLIEHGCDEIQGHYFSPALPPDKISLLLQENRRLEYV
ncbi:MAG: PAS domain S-box protein [Gammaproteobacteria bacterium]